MVLAPQVFQDLEAAANPPIGVNATPPSLLLATTVAPWNTVHKLLMRKPLRGRAGLIPSLRSSVTRLASR